MVVSAEMTVAHSIIRNPDTCDHPTSVVLDLLISNNSVLLVSGPLTMSYSRAKLAHIPALTLYNDEPTLSRRGQPISQLTCKGKPCKLYVHTGCDPVCQPRRRCCERGLEGMAMTILPPWEPPSWRFEVRNRST